MTLYEVNLSSGLKIPKGNFSLKSQEAKGGGVSKSQENFHYFNFDGMPNFYFQWFINFTDFRLTLLTYPSVPSFPKAPSGQQAIFLNFL